MFKCFIDLAANNVTSGVKAFIFCHGMKVINNYPYVQMQRNFLHQMCDDAVNVMKIILSQMIIYLTNDNISRSINYNDYKQQISSYRHTLSLETQEKYLVSCGL